MFVKVGNFIIATIKGYENHATELVREALKVYQPKKRKIGFNVEDEEDGENNKEDSVSKERD